MNRTIISLAVGISVALLAAQVVHARGFGGCRGGSYSGGGYHERRLPRQAAIHGAADITNGGYHEAVRDGGYCRWPPGGGYSRQRAARRLTARRRDARGG